MRIGANTLRRVFVDDRRGIAMVEFAILLPVLVFLYLGGYEILDASACRRRVTITARATADLASQRASLSSADIAEIMKGSARIMAPYDVAQARIRISQITVDAQGSVSVAWSTSNYGSARAPQSTLTIPVGLRKKNSSYIYSEVLYTYDASISKIFGAFNFSDYQFMVPRRSASITLTS